MPSFKVPVQTSPFVMLSSDYSQQEPKICAHVSSDESMIKAFQDGKDIYATIASIAFNTTYEQCLEFHPETHEYQKEGKARRTEAKSVVLGILYGRSTITIGEQLYGTDKSLTNDERTKKAQGVYDAVLNAFPSLRNLMINAQKHATDYGYVETILGRRRHIPDMMLPEFEFVPLKGYVNPDVDPLDPSTLQDQAKIPKRITDSLLKEFKNLKYFGQVIKRTKELKEEKIRVINNRPTITEASRQCVNCVDSKTEILTCNGWKYWNEISIGDPIYSYNMKSGQIVKDEIKAIHTYTNDDGSGYEVVEFDTPTFNAVSTLDHRWVTQESTDKYARFKKTENIYKNNWPDYPILRIADNEFQDNPNISDDVLKLIGWLLTDGLLQSSPYEVYLYQSTTKEKNLGIYLNMIDILNKLDIEYTDRESNGFHEIYLKKCNLTTNIIKEFPNGVLTYEFMNSLSQRQAEILMWSMIECDGTLGSDGTNITLCCSSVEKCNAFQFLCFIAGYATNSYEITPEDVNNYPSSNKVYSSVANKNPIKITKPYYNVSVLRIKRAHIYPHHKKKYSINFVWCVTTEQHTWIARRNGKVFITGNSIIQGSAADLTKMAILRIENSPEWQKLGGNIVTVVHDEIIAEVPMEVAEEGGNILSKLMCDAADFLPFDISCDVETSLRWYGNEFPCPYPVPKQYPTENKEEIKWIQWALLEMEYILPVYKDENGDTPRGNEGKGMNGVISEEYEAAIFDYMRKFNIVDESKFIDHLYNNVMFGIIK